MDINLGGITVHNNGGNIMNKKFTFVLLFCTLSLPLTALAATHEPADMKGMDHGSMSSGAMDHGSMAGMDHGSMAMKGDMIMLGEDTESGVKAMAHLKDVGAAMSKMGMDTTHHLMVMFADAKSGNPIEEGSAAVKITGPDGKTGEPVKLMGMGGHFGADVTLKQKGEYTFEVGSKLADGQKRTFEFKQTLK